MKDAVPDAVPSKVNGDINDFLTRDYSDEEIKMTLFQMGPTKAPGPDGFPALFYQNHWDLLQTDVCAAVRGFLTEIVSEQQSAFVPRRLITDSVLIAYECLQTIRKQRIKTPHSALKIDMT